MLEASSRISVSDKGTCLNWERIKMISNWEMCYENMKQPDVPHVVNTHAHVQCSCTVVKIECLSEEFTASACIPVGVIRP